MKQLSFLLILVFSVVFVNAQATDSSISKSVEDSVFTNPEVYAAFPGGDQAWRHYLAKNLDPLVPAMNGAPNGKYPVVIKFIVYKDGSIGKAEAETKYGFGMEAEAMRIILKGPKWIPAIHNGKTVDSYRRQPVSFYIE